MNNVKRGLLSGILVLLTFACNKNNTRRSRCVNLKYLGMGCYPVVQVVSPIDHQLGTWHTQDKDYSQCAIVIALPEQFKDGIPFSATLVSVNEDSGIRNALCTAPFEILVLDHYAGTSCILSD